ncbi:hypothetical protein B0H11DRAFT_1899840 [Mycena galericulata]|nr:hypothetical protein B0H11DRAFT_1899840 [Mycena galericulata]
MVGGSATEVNLCEKFFAPSPRALEVLNDLHCLANGEPVTQGPMQIAVVHASRSLTPSKNHALEIPSSKSLSICAQNRTSLWISEFLSAQINQTNLSSAEFRCAPTTPATDHASSVRDITPLEPMNWVKEYETVSDLHTDDSMHS